MIQVARSGKQNIAEGSAASSTWRETELKLTNVAKASQQEFLIDYEDYLRVRNLEQWSVNSSKAEQTRMACRKHNDSDYFRKAITVRPDETIANIAITLNHQTDSLPRKLIDHLKTEFLTHGGIKKRCMPHAKNGADRTNNKHIKKRRTCPFSKLCAISKISDFQQLTSHISPISPVRGIITPMIGHHPPRISLSLSTLLYFVLSMTKLR